MKLFRGPCNPAGQRLHTPSTVRPGYVQLRSARKVVAKGVHASTAVDAVDLMVSQPVLDLIAKSAGDAANHLDTHIMHSVAQAFDSTWATHASGHLGDQMSMLDSLQGIQAIGTDVPTVQAVSAQVETAAAAVQGLDLAALSSFAAEKLTVVQTLDPQAYETLSTSLASMFTGIESAIMETNSQVHLGPWTNALVLGVQQLVTTLRAPAGGVSLEAIVAAQEAMQVALSGTFTEATAMARAAGALTTSGAAAGELPAGLSGLLQLILALTAMTIAAVPKADWKKQAAAKGPPQLPTRYDVAALQAYFSHQPMLVLKRNTEVVSRLSAFCLTILADYRMGLWEANIKERAVWARKIVESLGPAYIKIAQAVATRVDVMPDAYVQELTRLQDNVATFSTIEARKVLEEGLNRPVDTVFEWLSEEPIAAASLGQVYRGKLRPEFGSAEVAVKVQRPGALESAALDIFVMRRAAVLFSQLPGMSDKWAEALDDWAMRFFMEMDYELEARNTMTFKKHMASLEGVKVATVYPELTSRKIIVTEWIEGQRLAESSAEDVRALCSTLLNCYLIQLLETGLLHADPHPGNLMRTPDGKIVVLDFGLMTEVTEEQRIALVEYIAHLTVEDWESVAQDLVTLGFMPDGLPPEATPLIAPVMEKVMGQLVRGGGLKNGFNIAGIASELSGVAMSYKFAIPPYFALVIRAFSVIEGIALKVDPNYAIVQECMPYMSRRLLTDNNPRMRAALKKLLYGNGTRLDVERLQRMITSFNSFTTAGATGPGEGAMRLASGPTFSSAASGAGAAGAGGLLGALLSASDDGPILTEPVKEVLKVVFSKDGSYAQEILVDEAVAAVDAMSREAMAEALRLVSTSASTVAALRGMEALGPLRAMLMPLPLPMDMLYNLQPSVTLSGEDRQALSTLRMLLDIMAPGPGRSGPGLAHMSVKAAKLASEITPLLPELMPGMQATLELFIRQLTRRMALRLASDLEARPGQSQQQYMSQSQYGNDLSPQSQSQSGSQYPPMQGGNGGYASQQQHHGKHHHHGHHHHGQSAQGRPQQPPPQQPRKGVW